MKIPMDSVPGREDDARDWIRDRVLNGDWAEAYEIVESLTVNIDLHCNPASAYGQNFYREQRPILIAALNSILETELAGFRFVNGILVPITDQAEIAEIEGASTAVGLRGLDGAKVHLDKALGFLGQKPKPDYHNSIKESISAVESVVNLVAESDGNGVSGALEALSKHTDIHGGLKAAMKQLYGYTSDKGGIRHAMIDAATVDFAEAKFMLVACSAFVNFLIARAGAAGLLKKR